MRETILGIRVGVEEMRIFEVEIEEIERNALSQIFSRFVVIAENFDEAKKAIQLIKLYSGIEEAIHGMKEVLTVKEVSSVKDVRELEEQ